MHNGKRFYHWSLHKLAHMGPACMMFTSVVRPSPPLPQTRLSVQGILEHCGINKKCLLTIQNKPDPGKKCCDQDFPPRVHIQLLLYKGKKQHVIIYSNIRSKHINFTI